VTEPLPAAQGRAARRRLAQSEQPILFLDVDGTLAPIVDRPDQARVPAATRATIRLLRRRGCQVVLVSGRSAEGAAMVAGPIADAILGNHGGEILRGDRCEPWVEGDAGRMKRVVDRLLARLDHDWPGTRLEPKGLSAAIHHRLDREGARRLVDWTLRTARDDEIAALPGRRVIDVRFTGVHKGEAVRRWLDGRTPAPDVLYAGDDTTDEDAFRALSGGTTILVGRRPTAARLRTPSPATLARWLARLADERMGRTGPR
jgi:trehalose-phosphatase